MSALSRLGRWVRCGALLTACGASGACFNAPRADQGLTSVPVVAPKPANLAAATRPYQLAPGDEFDVKAADAPQFDQTVKVRPDGKVTLGVIGTVYVAGRTAEDVQSEIRERYKELIGSDEQREYLIHTNDELEIKFPYYEKLNDQMHVRPDGKIQLQLVGTIRAEGMTPEELQTELIQRYGRFLKEPVLAVVVRSATSQSVRTASGTGRGGLTGLQPVVIVRTFQIPQIYVTGEVAKPGLIVYTPGLTLLQALSEAGGNLPSGDITKLVILRKTAAQTADLIRPNLPSTYRVAPTRDVELEPYDVIMLPPTRAQSLAEALDRYVYKIFAPLKNSSFGYVISNQTVY